MYLLIRERWGMIALLHEDFFAPIFFRSVTLLNSSSLGPKACKLCFCTFTSQPLPPIALVPDPPPLLLQRGPHLILSHTLVPQLNPEGRDDDGPAAL
jgi:hypothetical protein